MAALFFHDERQMCLVSSLQQTFVSIVMYNTNKTANFEIAFLLAWMIKNGPVGSIKSEYAI